VFRLAIWLQGSKKLTWLDWSQSDHWFNIKMSVLPYLARTIFRYLTVRSLSITHKHLLRVILTLKVVNDTPNWKFETKTNEIITIHNTNDKHHVINTNIVRIDYAPYYCYQTSVVEQCEINSVTPYLWMFILFVRVIATFTILHCSHSVK